MIKDEIYVLKNGVKIPKIGFGTWQSKSGEEAENAVYWALKYGYRHIDTALAYGNESSCAAAIRRYGIRREEVFITTKLPAEIKTYQGAKDAFAQSLSNLDTDYIDLYLIHAPWPWSNVGEDCTQGNIEVWKAMIELHNEGKIRAIGVSNFHVEDIEALIEATGFVPEVNQIRYFVGNTQEPITKYCQENNILVEAYSPLATGEMLNNPLMKGIAEKYNKSVAKLCIRFCLQNGTLPLPKSVTESRIADNLDLDFEISKEDMEFMNELYHISSTRPLRD